MLFEFIDVPQSETRGRRYIVDQQLKVCTKCDRGWEHVNKRIYHVDHIIYQKGMIPKIGKEKKTCPQCITSPKTQFIKKG